MDHMRFHSRKRLFPIVSHYKPVLISSLDTAEQFCVWFLCVCIYFSFSIMTFADTCISWQTAWLQGLFKLHKTGSQYVILQKCMPADFCTWSAVCYRTWTSAFALNNTYRRFCCFFAVVNICMYRGFKKDIIFSI